MAFALGAFTFPSSITCKATSISSSSHDLDAAYIKRAANLADSSAGFTAPHPNFGCVITSTNKGRERVVVLGEGYLYGEGTMPAELQAVEAAGELCRGATAYLNMEPSDCTADHTSVSAIVQVSNYNLSVTFCIKCCNFLILFSGWKIMREFTVDYRTFLYQILWIVGVYIN